jgi:hypothetical protein
MRIDSPGGWPCAERIPVRCECESSFVRHGITVKKSLRAAEQQRADVARARRRWIREQGFLDPARLVFIDETAVSTNMVRPNGRSPRGERLIGYVPLAQWETVTFVAQETVVAETHVELTLKSAFL